MKMLSVIMERNRRNHGISALEYEHFTATAVAAALEMACNAFQNTTNYNARAIREMVQPERILDEIKEDFTAMVQQYWPAGIGDELTKERAKETPGIIGDNDGPWPVITRADVRKAHGMEAVSQDPATQAQVAMIIAVREKRAQIEGLGLTEAIRERRSSLSFPADNAPNVAVHIDPTGESEDSLAQADEDIQSLMDRDKE